MQPAPSIESIRTAALQLCPADRMELTHALLDSLFNLTEADIADFWLAEAERRDADVESGKVAGIPGNEVFRRIRAIYDK